MLKIFKQLKLFNLNKVDTFPLFLLLFWFGHIVSIYLNINNIILFIISGVLFVLSFKFIPPRFLIALFLGMINANIFLYPNLSEDDLSYYNLNSKVVTIEGVIKKATNYRYAQGLIVDTDKIHKDGYQKTIFGKISLFNKSKYFFKAGDRVVFRTKLYKPLRDMNYGTFNQRSFLKQKGIYYSATLKYKRDFKIISNDNLTFLEKSRVGIRDFIYNKLPSSKKEKENENNTFNKRDNKKLDNKNSLRGFFATILLGERTFLDKSLKDDMLSLGIMHLFAISGFHIGLLFLIIYQFVLFLLRRSLFVVKRIDIQKSSLIFSLLFIVFYLWLIDFQTSATRAVIMISLFVIANILERRFSTINILSLAAFIILISQSGVFLNVGFYLSFMAVLTFIIPIQFFKHNFYIKNKFKKFLFEYLIINVSLFIVTTPILLFVFYKVSFGQLIFNLIYIPLFSFFIYPIAILALLLSLFLSSDILFNFNYNIFKVITDFLTGDYFLYHPINIMQLVLSMISILFFLIILSNIEKTKEFITQKLFLYIILFFILLYFTIFVPINRFDGINIYNLSVGNGDAILITDNNKSLLIDAGSALKGRNGERVLAPHLDYLGIDKVDYMILTHQDEDHYGGLQYLAKHNRINKLYLNTTFDEPLANIDIDYEMIPDYKEIQFDNIKIKLYASMLLDDKNANSIITLIEYKNYKFLFTGDATQEREKIFIKKNPEIKDIDFLKAGHHGSHTSSALEFLSYVNPKITVFSSGINNRFGHPHKEVLDRMKKLNLKYYRTDKCGEVHLNILEKIRILTHNCKS